MEASQKKDAIESKFSRVMGMLPVLARTVFPEGYLDFFSQRWCNDTSIRVGETSCFGRAPLYHEDLPAVVEC